MDGLTKIMVDAHQPVLEPRPVMDRSQKNEMRKMAFGTTVNTLQRSYSKLLHATFEGQHSPEIAGGVRNLADSVVWKLKANCESSADQGERLMKEMLEHLQVEFKWEKAVKILEAATEVARGKKATAYEYVRISEDRLRNIRQAGDCN